MLQFRFDPQKRARRFRSVKIEMIFKGVNDKDTSIEVFGIAPNGRLSLMPTTQHEDIKKNANLQIGGVAPGGISAMSTIGWEKSVGRDTDSQTAITGSINLVKRTYGPSDSASWTH